MLLIHPVATNGFVSSNQGQRFLDINMTTFFAKLVQRFLFPNAIQHGVILCPCP